MERLTDDERTAVLAACKNSLHAMETNRIDADRWGASEAAAYWVREATVLTSAYDKLISWPWEPEA